MRKHGSSKIISTDKLPSYGAAFREIDKDLSVITVKYTTTSIMKDIFKADRLINKNAVPLSLSGSKSALHRLV